VYTSFSSSYFASTLHSIDEVMIAKSQVAVNACRTFVAVEQGCIRGVFTAIV
jgi:hypothetical protein